MQLELKSPEGKVLGTVEFPVEELKASLSDSLKEQAEAQLKEKDEELTTVTAELTELREYAIDSRDPKAIGQVMIDFGTKLTEVGFRALAKKTGHEALLKDEASTEEVDEGTVMFAGEPEDPENWELLPGISAFVGYKVYKKK